jgi:hypothetical protein
MPSDMAIRVAVMALATLFAATGSAAGDSSPPRVGVTFTNALVPSDCRIENAFVKTYHRPGVRKLARLQLAAMHAAGIDTINSMLWHLDEPATDDTNNIPSLGGRIAEPYRTNLIHFVGDIRSAGFKNLTVNYGPQWTNNPLGDWRPDGSIADIWDPSKLDENWEFIRDTRTLIHKYGPTETWFDPVMELEPTDYIETVFPQRLDDYIAEVYRRYVAAFGKDDLVFFVGGSGDYLPAYSERFIHLIAALKATGLGMPRRFGVHPGPWTTPAFVAAVRLVDDTLRAHGLDQPLVIGEAPGEGPNSGAIAEAIADFARTSDRDIPEVFTWWSTDLSRNCQSPPYSANSYVTALSGSPPSTTLRVTVGTTAIDFRTPYQHTATALEAGVYRLVVEDRSAKANFHLVGPGIDKKTGVAFRGRASWTISLRAGNYRYRSDRPLSSKAKELVVLTPNGVR